MPSLLLRLCLALSLAAPVTAHAAEPNRGMLHEYARKRARLVEKQSLVVFGTGNNVASGVSSQYFRIMVGMEQYCHWQFAKLHAEKTRASIPEDIVLLYDPPDRRRGGLVGLGFGAGGGLVGASAFAALFGYIFNSGPLDSEGHVCEPDDYSYDAQACAKYESDVEAARTTRRNFLLAGGIGAGIGVVAMAATVVYVASTNPAKNECADYLTPDELALMIDEYNAAVRRELGLPDDIKDAPDVEDVQVWLPPALRREPSLWERTQLAISPLGFSVRVTF